MMVKEADLRLEIKTAHTTVYLNQPCPVTVTLGNDGSAAVRVNRRLAPGFWEQDARELVAELHEAGSGQPVKLKDITIDRRFSPESDYILLAPGTAVTRTIDLFRTYKPIQPGIYTLTVYYQADESLAPTPADIAEGITRSNSIELKVEAGVYASQR